MSISVTHTPQTVTVYPDRARVMHEGSAELPAGRHTLSIDGLPLALIVDSVRVSGSGTAAVRIYGVEVKRTHHAAAPVERFAELERIVEGLQDEARALADERAALNSQVAFLDLIRENALEFARSLSRGRTTAEDLGGQMGFILQQDRDARTAIRGLDAKERTVKREIDQRMRELKELQSARPRVQYQALVDVETAEACVFRPKLSYLVQKARWQPLYDVRLLEAEAQTLEVTALAQVTNQSGQDWDGVALTVSTARPALNQRKPELKPWFIDDKAPQPRRVRSAPRAQSKAMPAAAPVMDAMMMEPELESAPQEAAAVVASQETSGSAVTFHIPGATTVPSDGGTHKVTIGHFSLKPAIDYVAVPRHTDSVFRRVTVDNDTGAPLLSGPANLFTEETFIGSNRIDYTAPGAPVELLLGIEERITVERELARRDVDKRLLRDQRQIRFGYTIKVENLLPHSADITVEDQIPVSRHETIKVKLDPGALAPTEVSDLNLIKWRFRLEPDASRAISYEFTVQHPRETSIYGLNV